MDKAERVAHLESLLAAEKSLVERVAAHRDHLLSHHASRERDRSLTQAKKALRRSDKVVRGLERALRNEGKSRGA